MVNIWEHLITGASISSDVIVIVVNFNHYFRWLIAALGYEKWLVLSTR